MFTVKSIAAVLALAVAFPTVALADSGKPQPDLILKITDPDQDEDPRYDELKRKSERFAAPMNFGTGFGSGCVDCGDTPAVSGVSAWQKPWEDTGKCSKFNAGSAVGTFHWVDLDVDVTAGANNWAAAGSSAQAFVSSYCQSNPDPAGFAHHIQFARSCTLKHGWGFQGAPKVFAHYQGCYSETSAALPGSPMMLYADKVPVEFVNPAGGGFDVDNPSGLAPGGHVAIPAKTR